MDFAERWARRTGFSAFRLEVRDDNAGAIRFYEKRGYRQYGRLDSYYEDGHPARRMPSRCRSLSEIPIAGHEPGDCGPVPEPATVPAPVGLAWPDSD